MLRRVATVLRWGLLAIGLALLALWPVSHFVGFAMDLPWPRGNALTAVYFGSALVYLDAGDFPLQRSGFRTFDPAALHEALPARLRPTWERFNVSPLGTPTTITFIHIPLWLLAATCLTWPVTSFIVARRRRAGRGFEVAEVTSQNPAPPGAQRKASNGPPDCAGG